MPGGEPASSVYEYVCGACGHSRPRLRSVQDHCGTKRAAATHPLGKGTAITRRRRHDSPRPRFMQLDDDRAALAVQMTRSAADLEARSAALARRCAEHDALARRLQDWTPRHPFLGEPLPAERSLPARLAEVFGGTTGIVAHLTWTHVHSAGTVRCCGRPGHLAAYGLHGWHLAPARELASRACDALPARLDSMWAALSTAAAAPLRRAAAHFARECGALLGLGPTAFGASAGPEPRPEARARLVEDVAGSMLHCAGSAAPAH